MGGLVHESYNWIFNQVNNVWICLATYNPQIIGGLVYSNFKDATVSILAGVLGTGTFNGAGGSGFVIAVQNNYAYIVTNAHVVLQNEGVNPGDPLYPFISSQFNNANNIPQQSVQCACVVLGLDRAGDIALIRTQTTLENPNTGFDFDANQKVLAWGNNTLLKKGSPAIIIGNPRGYDFQSIVVGTVRDNKYIVPDDTAGESVEQLFTNGPVQPGNSGSPVIDSTGRVVGIAGWIIATVLNSNPPGFTVSSPIYNMSGGASQFIAEPVTNYFLANNPIGPGFIDYPKGFLGMSEWAVTEGAILEAYRTVFPLFLAGANDLANGISILSIYPSVAPFGLANAVIAFPLGYTIQPLDIILSINGMDVGVNDNQYSPTRISWLNPPGTPITLQLLKPSTNVIYTASVILDAYPAALDYVLSGAVSIPIPPIRVKQILRI